jgi:alcohol dehydrogenase class IV
VADNLPEFTYNRLNEKAAEALAWAQFLGALTYAMGGGSGPVHSHAHAISAVMNMHHGLSNAITLVPVLKYMYRAAPERYAEMAYYVYGVDTRNMSRIQAAEKFVEKTEELRNICGITDAALNLRQYDIKDKDLPFMAKHAVNDFCSEAAPADLSEQDCLNIFKSLM